MLSVPAAPNIRKKTCCHF